MRLNHIIVIVLILGGAALFAWKKGYFGEARKAYESSFGVHYTNGKSLYTKTEYEAAIVELEKAIEIDPNHADVPLALRCMADCYKNLKQPDKAIALYQRILDEYPEHAIRGSVEKSLEKTKSMGYW